MEIELHYKDKRGVDIVNVQSFKPGEHCLLLYVNETGNPVDTITRIVGYSELTGYAVNNQFYRIPGQQQRPANQGKAEPGGLLKFALKLKQVLKKWARN